MAKKKKPRKAEAKRNPNDATFRNINALKRRVAKLERAVADLYLPGVARRIG